MMELDFREGNAADAARMLKLGRHVIVTQEYRKLQGIGLGDKLPLKTNKGMVDFTIAGVVWSPGIDVIASLYDLGRQLDQRTAASVFGSLDDAREYFGVDSIHLFATNIDANIKKDNIVWQIQYQFARKGLDASDVRSLKYMIQRAFSKLLILVAVVAYAAMAIAALGVTNTILASIRSRRWHFGILRSIGVTRSQLVRLVLAEATLLGIVGIALGLGAGFELTINANLAWGLFVGYQPPILVPWTSVGVGVGVVLLVSLLASLWPATQVAQTEPLSLLQAGRAAM
jgi:putative ABC transport system permease protein